MRKLFLLLVIQCFGFITYAQAIAYPATFDTYAVSSCIDLTGLNAIVQGHQLDYIVSYHATLSDAQSNSNPFSQFYTYNSFNEIVYARVTNHLDNTDFATSEITISLSSLPCCPPPPPGYNGYTFCDTDNDGSAVAYLPNLRYLITYGYPPPSFCDLDDSQINTMYYASQADADSNINALDEIYTFSETTEIYYKMTNTVNSETYQAQFGIGIENCPISDTDGDGIQDSDEDVNKNGNYFDDDTDLDGLKNYEDDDDDGDTILTINEDYNSNGTALDDDTNNNGIADYLEASVTLSVETFTTNSFVIVENPINHFIKLKFKNNAHEKFIRIMDINGKQVYRNKSFLANQKHDLSFLASGLYFISAEINGNIVYMKFIKK